MESGAVILAVSGGADSCALAAAAADLRERGKLNCRLIVAHFDHGLREGSDADTQFVRNLANDLELDFQTGKAPKSAFRSRSNLEEKARKARYFFLTRLAKKMNAGCVVTAHTMNDQAETLLMNLVRGSGVTGLSAMDPVRPLEVADEPTSRPNTIRETGSGPLLCRPLLIWAERRDTEGYVNDCGITPVEDPMNLDPAFLRVHIRREVIPLLAKLNPSVVRTLSSVAETLSIESKVMSGDAEHLAKAAAIGKGNTVRISELLELPFAARVYAVREWLGHKRGTFRGIDLKHSKSIAALAASGKSGKVVEIPRSGRVMKKGGRLSYEEVKVEK